MLSNYDFADIKPGETDTRFISFIDRARGAGVVNAVWNCTVSPYASTIDPDPASRLLGLPNNYAAISEQTFSNMINGCVYDVFVTATLNDGRVLMENRNISCNTEPVPPPPDSVLTPAKFKDDLEAFDSPQYTTESIQYWINIAVLQLNAARFKDMYLYAQEWFVAHQITLEHYNETIAARNGGIVPIGVGPASSRSVGGVSVSYDYNLSSYQDAGYYNLTIYGQRLWNLIQMYGAGPIQF